MTLAGLRARLDDPSMATDKPPLLTRESLTDLVRDSITTAYAQASYPVICSESEAQLIHWIEHWAGAPEFIEVDGVKYQKYHVPPPPKPKRRRKRRITAE